MRRYFCDVCGREFDGTVPDTGQEQAAYEAREACSVVQDVCPSCEAAGRKLNIAAVILGVWRDAVGIGGLAGIDESLSVLEEKPNAGQTLSEAVVKQEEPVAAVGQKPGWPKPEPHGALSGLEVWDASPSEPSPAKRKREIPETDNLKPAVKSRAKPGRKPKVKSDKPKPGVGSDTKSVEALSEKPEQCQTAGSASRSRKTESKARSQASAGSHWAEKREILSRLTTYRQNEGMGCITRLADCCKLSPDVIRSMLSATPHSIEDWREVNRGLDKVVRTVPEAKQEPAET